MISEEELELGELRLLEVDNRVVLPVNLHVRILVTAADVLHSWALPSLGIKVDACTGRLNQTSLFVLREGVFLVNVQKSVVLAMVTCLSLSNLLA